MCSGENEAAAIRGVRIMSVALVATSGPAGFKQTMWWFGYERITSDDEHYYLKSKAARVQKAPQRMYVQALPRTGWTANAPFAEKYME